MATMPSRRLDWPGGSATQHSLGGMLAQLALRLPDGRLVEPLHRPPWFDEPPLPDLPAILQGLQGDFACVPFGTGDPAPLPARWQAMGISAPPQGPPHGYGANNLWQIDCVDGGLHADITYPDPHPIARLTRSLHPAGPGRVDLALTIEPRRDCRLPIALHPMFRLPAALGTALLRPGAHGPIWTHPCGPGPDPCPLRPDSIADSLQALPGQNGETLDFSRLPLAGRSESRLLITGTDGSARLDHSAEGWSVTLTWDADVLPSLMLWLSNRGRSQPPWNSRHLALGLEPCAAAFDLGVAASTAHSPLTASGVQTTVSLRAGKALQIRYAISVSAL